MPKLPTRVVVVTASSGFCMPFPPLPRPYCCVVRDVESAGLVSDRDGLLFRTTGRKTGKQHAMKQQDAYRMIQRRAAAAGVETKICRYGAGRHY